MCSKPLVSRHTKLNSAAMLVIQQKLRWFCSTMTISSQFSIGRRDIDILANRLLMEPAILLFNADRLRNYCAYFLKLYDRFQRRILCGSVPSGRESALDSSQMVLLLEFYLQMDGKVGSISLYSGVLTFMLSLQWISSTWKHVASEVHGLDQPSMVSSVAMMSHRPVTS